MDYFKSLQLHPTLDSINSYIHTNRLVYFFIFSILKLVESTQYAAAQFS